MQSPEGLHEVFVDTAVGVNRVFRGLMPSASKSELSRQLFARALRDLPMTKDALLTPWVNTCLNIWELRGDYKDDTNKQSIVKAVAPNMLRSVLTKKWEKSSTPEAVKLSTEQANVVRFLGFEDENAFMDKMPGVLHGKIDKLMSGESEGGIHETLKPVFEFAEAGYGTRSPRKGGESYYCHALRVLYYTLDHLVETGTRITSPQDMVDIVTIALLHDAKEDFVGLTLSPLARPPATPEQRNKYYQSNDPRARSLYTYCIDLPNGEGTKKLSVSTFADKCIQTLTSPEVETDADKFRKVIVKSPWSIVEIIKSMDRLDNVLTYIFPTDSWWKYLYKMYESTLGMSRLSTAAEVTHPLERGPKIDRHPPGEFVAYGMMMNALYGIRKEFFDEISEYTDMSLHQNMKQHLNGQRVLTLDDPQFPGIDVMLQKVVDRMHNDGQQNEPEILCMKDLLEYEKGIKGRLNNYIAFGPRTTGYGQRPYVRQKSSTDMLQGLVRDTSKAAMYLGPVALRGGVISGILYQDLAEGKIHEAIIKSLVMGMSFSTGGLVGNKLYHHLYDRLPKKLL